MAHAVAEIDLDAIRSNVAILKRCQSSWVEMIAVVKANAYGHGAPEVSRVLLEAGIGRLGVAFPCEAIALREAGISAPILLLGSFDLLEIDQLLRYDVTPSIWDSSQARQLSERARRAGRRIRVHLDVDTGMSRLGVPFEDALRFALEVRQLDGLILEGIHTHFATADEEDSGFAQLQQRRFRKVLGQLAQEGVRIPVVHTQNSAALLSLEESGVTAVRPGLALYGLMPGSARSADALRPALAFRSRVVQVRKVPAGTFVSYGRTYRSPTDRHLATVSAGYADGYPRCLSNRGQVLIRGKRYPVVGRVTMDHMVVDLGREATAQVGDRVTLIGRDGDQAIDAAELASWAGTVHYEIVTSISPRVPRQFRGALGRTAHSPGAMENDPAARRVASR